MPSPTEHPQHSSTPPPLVKSRHSAKSKSDSKPLSQNHADGAISKEQKNVDQGQSCCSSWCSASPECQFAIDWSSASSARDTSQGKFEQNSSASAPGSEQVSQRGYDEWEFRHGYNDHKGVIQWPAHSVAGAAKAAADATSSSTPAKSFGSDVSNASSSVAPAAPSSGTNGSAAADYAQRDGGMHWPRGYQQSRAVGIPPATATSSQSSMVTTLPEGRYVKNQQRAAHASHTTLLGPHATAVQADVNGKHSSLVSGDTLGAEGIIIGNTESRLQAQESAEEGKLLRLADQRSTEELRVVPRMKKIDGLVSAEVKSAVAQEEKEQEAEVEAERLEHEQMRAELAHTQRAFRAQERAGVRKERERLALPGGASWWLQKRSGATLGM